MDDGLLIIVKHTIQIITNAPTSKKILLQILYLVHAYSPLELYQMLIPMENNQCLAYMWIPYNGEIDFDLLRDLPLITPSCSQRMVYLHPGHPSSVDGPNELASTQEIVYLGSATSGHGRDDMKSKLTGGASRIYSRSNGHKSQSHRLDIYPLR